MEQDRSLDEEGIPDLEGPLPEKAATGDPQEGMAPPADRPASLDYGVTAEEQLHDEPLDDRLAREVPDVFDDEDAWVEPGTEADLGHSPEEAAMHVERQAGGS